MDKVYKNIHEDLISGCRRNDAKSQTKVYELYHKAMYNTSLRIVKDEFEAEDVMQESFLAAFKKIDTFKGEVSFGSWLKRIVINRSINELKKKKIEWASDKFIKDIPQEEEQENEKAAMDVKKIYQAMNYLSDGYRVILSLYLLEGYDHEEIGQVLSISPSTSRSQYTRAKQKLKSLVLNN